MPRLNWKNAMLWSSTELKVAGSTPASCIWSDKNLRSAHGSANRVEACGGMAADGGIAEVFVRSRGSEGCNASGVGCGSSARYSRRAVAWAVVGMRDFESEKVSKIKTVTAEKRSGCQLAVVAPSPIRQRS